MPLRDRVRRLRPLAGGAVGRKLAEEALRDTKEELQALIEASPIPIIAYDAGGIVTLWNRAAERVFGWSEAEAVGQFLPIVQDEMREEFEAVRGRVLAGGSFSGFETVRRRKDGSPIEVSFWNAPVRDRNGEVRGVVALVNDITERRRVERRLAAQYRVTKALAESNDFAEAGPRVLGALGGSLGWDVGAIWRVDDETSALHCSAFWHARASEAPAFEALTRELSFTRGEEGLPARIWAAGEPHWVSELSGDASFTRLPVATSEGLRSGFGLPILLGGQVLGVIELFGREPRERDEALLEALAPIGTQVGQFIERTRSEDDRGRLLEALTLGEERYRSLVEATSQIVWVTDARGLQGASRSAEWLKFTGQSGEEADGQGWLDAVHPEDRERVAAAWQAAVETETPLYETEYRLRLADGTYRDVATRGVPVRAADGSVREWVGVCVDIGPRKRKEEALRFLAEASTVLASSLDFPATLARVVQLAVPAIADWCFLDILQEDGSATRIEVAHADPAKARLAEEARRFGPGRDWETPQAQVLRSGQPVLLSDVTDQTMEAIAHDSEHLSAMRAVGPRSMMYVPLQARGHMLGALTFVSAESGRRYGDDDLLLAEEIARRAAVAVDNARLYHEVEERAEAARVLAAIGDGVFLVDGAGVIRLWNPAAEAITGLPSAAVVGRRLEEAVPGWSAVAPPGGRAETVPLELDGRELWLSVTGVGFSEGTVYAFRDLTEERQVDELKAEFVATVSHELRTPLAAVYGAAMTLRRPDLELDEPAREGLLKVIADQSDRLAGIINDVLLASRLDTGSLRLARERFDPVELSQAVVAAARAHLPESVEIAVTAPPELPPVAADADRVRQVLANLLDNAVKYSPGGGLVEVILEEDRSHLRFSVRDPGLGVPRPEQERIFEKFYRVDSSGHTPSPGGTGLGLYICRELVRRMGGQMSMDSEPGHGSTFSFALPLE